MSGGAQFSSLSCLDVGAAFSGIVRRGAERLASVVACRRSCRLAPAIAVLTLAITAQATDRVVVAVRGEKTPDSAARSDFVSQTKAELEAAGLEAQTTSRSPVGLSAADLESLALPMNASTILAIDQAEGQVTATVWTRGRSGTTVVRSIPPEPTSTAAPHLFALRATELVRAALLEANEARSAPVPGAPLPDNSSSSTSSESRKRIGIFVGSSLVMSPGVLPLSFAPMIEVAWRPHRLWSIAIAATGPLVASTRATWSGVGWNGTAGAGGRGPNPGGGPGPQPWSGAAGNPETDTELAYDVSYEQELFMIAGAFGPTATRALLAPFVFAGAGAYRLVVQPGSVPDRVPVDTSSSVIWAPYGGVGGGLRWNLTSAVAVRLDIGLGLAWWSSGTTVRGLSSVPAAPLTDARLGIEVAPW